MAVALSSFLPPGLFKWCGEPLKKLSSLLCKRRRPQGDLCQPRNLDGSNKVSDILAGCGSSEAVPLEMEV